MQNGLQKLSTTDPLKSVYLDTIRDLPFGYLTYFADIYNIGFGFVYIIMMIN